MEQILDRKVTQSEFDSMVSPMELDLIAFFKILEESVLAETFEDDISPEQMIQQIIGLFDKPSGSIQVQKAGKVYQIGDTKIRPDGTTWQKTGTYSWKKVVTGGTPTTNTIPIIPPTGMTGPKAMDAIKAKAIIDKSGKKGFWNLTKDGLLNWLGAHGVDATNMSFKDKKITFEKLYDQDKSGGTTSIINKPDIKPEVLIKPLPFVAFSNKNMIKDWDKKDIKDLMKYAVPTRGHHWGSADTYNQYARAVACTSGTAWKPINKMQDGHLKEYDQKATKDDIIKGASYRKYAQERIKKHDRKEVPNFYRGMTLDPKVWAGVANGDIDTLELTGATAFSCYEAVADRYSKSSWTKGFGADRQSVKIILERDDHTDDSIGFWHEANSNTSNNPKPAFEMLSGLESIKIVKVEGAKVKDTSPLAITKKFKNNLTKVIDIANLAHNEFVNDITDRRDYYQRRLNDNSSPVGSYGWKTNNDRFLKAEKQIKDLETNEKWVKDSINNDNIQDIIKYLKDNDVLPTDIKLGRLDQMARRMAELGMSDNDSWWDNLQKNSPQYTRVQTGLPDALIDMPLKDMRQLNLMFNKYNKGRDIKYRTGTKPAGLSGAFTAFKKANTNQRLVLHCVAGRGKNSSVKENTNE